MTLLKVSQCRGLLERDREYRTSTSNLTSELFLDMLNPMSRDFHKLEVFKNPKKHELQSIVSSGSSHDFPDILTIDNDSGGVFKLDDDGNLTDERLLEKEEGSRDIGWYFKDKTLYFTPIDISAINYMLKYTDKIGTLTKDDDDTLFDEYFSEYVKRALLRQFFIWNQKGDINLQDALYRQELNNMIIAPRKQHGLNTNSKSFA